MDTQITIDVPQFSLETLHAVAKSKGISVEHAAALMVHFACRLLEDGGMQSGTDLMADLDFGRALRREREARLDQLLPLAEKVLLDSQGLRQAMLSHSLREAAQ